MKPKEEATYRGATVQVIPHVTNEIKKSLKRLATEQEADVVIAEIGGTVGDIESLPFLEAIRQMRKDVGYEDLMHVHVTLVPQVGPWEVMKPTQHSVYKLREIGITPDVLVCRTETPLDDDVKEKISLFCDVPSSSRIESLNVDTIYEVPLYFENAGLAIRCRASGVGESDRPTFTSGRSCCDDQATIEDLPHGGGRKIHEQRRCL